MINYVLGFYFDGSLCLFINNGKQANGIGGKVSITETHKDAMIREFKEETGITTNVYDWQRIMMFGGEHNKPRHDEAYRCHVFVCRNGRIPLPFEYKTNVGIVKPYHIESLPDNIHPTAEWIYKMIIDDVFIGHFSGNKDRIIKVKT